MAWYRTGTVTVTNGSTTVTGSGTQWIANAGIGEGLLAPDGRIYEILDIVSNTSLRIASSYLGSSQSGQAYVIVPTQSYIRDLAAAAASLVESYDMSTWGQDFTKSANVAAARTNLGLGTAATKDVTTSATDNTNNKIVKVHGSDGWFGLGGYGERPNNISSVTEATPNCFFSIIHTSEDVLPWSGDAATMGLSFGYRVGSGSTYSTKLFAPTGINTKRRTSLAFVSEALGEHYGPYVLYNTGNTTVDGNGFVKEASPIVDLYDDRIEAQGFHSEAPAFTKLSTGVYQIAGTSGLAQKGWYIETPRNRNHEPYFNIDWEQDVTPTVDDDGMVDEPQDVTLTIRTYERVWNPQTGTHDNGAPVDITERYVSLRFVEVRQPEEEELEDEGDVA